MCSLFLIKKNVKCVCGGGGGPCTKSQGLADQVFIFYITRNNKNPLMRLRYFILTESDLENIQTNFL